MAVWAIKGWLTAVNTINAPNRKDGAYTAVTVTLDTPQHHQCHLQFPGRGTQLPPLRLNAPVTLSVQQAEDDE